MSEETVKQKKLTTLPANYYFFGDPGRVIDQAGKLAQLDGNINLQDQRQSLAKDVIIFCPVPFLDELIEALASSIEEKEDSVKALRDKASNNEVSLKTNHNLSEEEKNQMSALALQLLNEKIINSNTDQILTILRFVQKYIEVQVYCQDLAMLKIAKLDAQKKQLDKKIQIEEFQLKQKQETIFYDFAQQLSQLDF